jgi:2-C-methyl-D-erythritol 4-phosphate cytidylyltransferase
MFGSLKKKMKIPKGQPEYRQCNGQKKKYKRTNNVTVLYHVTIILTNDPYSTYITVLCHAKYILTTDQYLTYITVLYHANLILTTDQ